jgi:DNA-directed RNA polymerase specialized sigma24 family protein
MTLDHRTLADELEALEPVEALRRVAELRARLGAEEAVHVHRARNAGLSWAEIAEALGVSRQAVHKKHRGSRWGRG